MIETIKKEQIEEFNKVFHRMFKHLARNNFFVFKGKLHDISAMELMIIATVYRSPDIILKEILDIVKIPNSTLSSIINRLENMGLIRRIISRRDKRSFGLELTKDGKDVMEEHMNQEKKIFRVILSALDNDSERKEFIRLFTKITNKLLEE